MIVARWIDPVNSSKPPNLGIGPSRPNLNERSSNTSLTRPRTARSNDSTSSHPDFPRSSLSSTDSSRTDRTEKADEKDRSQAHHEVLYPKDSHTARLRQILNEPAVRSLFREYLRKNFCEENLSFWLEVQDLKRKFSTSSSAVGSSSPKSSVAGHLTMEKHQQELLNCAFVIFNSEWRHAFILTDRLIRIIPPASFATFSNPTTMIRLSLCELSETPSAPLLSLNP